MRLLRGKGTCASFLSGLLLSAACAFQCHAGAADLPDLTGEWEADIGAKQQCVLDFRTNQTIRLSSKGVSVEGYYRLDPTSAPIKLDLYDMMPTGGKTNKYSVPQLIVAIIQFSDSNRMLFCSADVRSGETNSEAMRPAKFEGDVLNFTRKGFVAPPPAEPPPPPQPAPHRPTNAAFFQGNWQIEFVFQRNTKNPDEAPQSWATFDCSFIQKGTVIMGSLKGTNGTAPAIVTGNLTEAGIVGTMRMPLDDHNWQIFALRPISTNMAEGVAIFAPRPNQDDERDIYWLKARRK
jgi:hypothetical protein